jgi:hypothetical protein
VGCIVVGEVAESSLGEDIVSSATAIWAKPGGWSVVDACCLHGGLEELLWVQTRHLAAAGSACCVGTARNPSWARSTLCVTSESMATEPVGSWQSSKSQCALDVLCRERWVTLQVEGTWVGCS